MIYRIDFFYSLSFHVHVRQMSVLAALEQIQWFLETHSIPVLSASSGFELVPEPHYDISLMQQPSDRRATITEFLSMQKYKLHLTPYKYFEYKLHLTLYTYFDSLVRSYVFSSTL